MKNKIQELRKAKGFTQDALAKKCKVSRQTINAIENNRYDPTAVFGTTVDNVFKE
ncbi:helix-turn-helix transcriptional regulator [Virgibacillus oceani]